MNDKFVQVTYKIDKITELEYSIIPKPSDFTISPEDLEFNLSTTLTLPNDYRGVIVILKINGAQRVTKEILFTFTTENRFAVANYEEAIKSEGHRFHIPDNFLIDIFSLSVGAARGMLLIRNAGTYLNNIVLPIFNPVDILQGIKTVSAAAEQQEQLGLEKNGSK
jgi:hypothetical protein